MDYKRYLQKLGKQGWKLSDIVSRYSLKTAKEVITFFKVKGLKPPTEQAVLDEVEFSSMDMPQVSKDVPVAEAESKQKAVAPKKHADKRFCMALKF